MPSQYNLKLISKNAFQHSPSDPEKNITSSSPLTQPSSLIAVPNVNATGQQMRAVGQTSVEINDKAFIPCSETEIESFSLLEKKSKTPFPLKNRSNPNAKLPAPPNDEILRTGANILGGGLITGGKDWKLDGLDKAANYKTWEWLLQELYVEQTNKELPEVKILQEMLKGISSLKEFAEHVDNSIHHNAQDSELQKFAARHAEVIKELRPGESHSILGGYHNIGGGEGHSIIYEFIRRQDGHYDIQLYNSTHYELTDVLEGSNKMRLKPFIRYQGVPESVILFNSDGEVRPAFVQSLIEHHFLVLWDSSYVADDEDVLECFDYLERFRVPVAPEDCGAISGQRGGTCVPSATKVWIRLHSGHVGQYKQIMFHLKLKLMIGIYQNSKDIIKKDNASGEYYRRLLKHAAHNLLRRTAKMADGIQGSESLISKEFAQQSRATAHHLLREISVCEDQIAVERNKATVSSDLSKSTTEQQRIKRGQIVWKRENPDNSGADIHPWELPDFSINMSNGILPALNATILWCQKANQNKFFNSTAYNSQINSLVDQLPIPRLIKSANGRYQVDPASESFWKTLSENELLQCQEQLNELAILYTKKSEEDLITRRYTTVHTLHALVHYLAVKIDNKKNYTGNARLDSFAILFDNECMTMEGLTYLDRNEYERLQQVKDYFQKFNSGKEQVLFKNENTTALSKNEILAVPDNYTYWSALTEQNKSLNARFIEKGNQKWPDLSEAEIERQFRDMEKVYNEWSEKYLKYQRYTSYKERLDRWSKESSGMPKPENPYGEGVVIYSPGPAPANPIRKVNLLEDTKKWLAAEESVSLSKTYPELKYINYLRKMTYFSWQTSMKGNTDPAWLGLNCTASRDSPFTTNCKVNKPQSTHTKSESIQKEVDNLHPPLSKEHKTFVQNSAAKRNAKDWQSHMAEALALLKKFPEGSLLHRLYRTLTEWKLTPNQFIYEFTKELDSLKDSSLQGLFFYLFFRSPITLDGREHLGAGGLLPFNQALCDNAKEFISRGLNHFNSNKNLQGGRFFFELSFLISKYLVDAGFPEKGRIFDQELEIRRWLADKSFKESDNKFLHFYRVLFYTLKSPRDLSEDDLISLYSSWLSYNLSQSGSSGESSRVLGKMANNSLLKITSLLASKFMDPRFCSKLGDGILAQLKLENGSHSWKIDPVNGIPFIISEAGNRKWTLDLATGRIFSEKGQIKGLDTSFPWEARPDFQRIFPDKSGILYHLQGDRTVLFIHPKMGQFRIMPNSNNIQKYFPEAGQWYQYQPPQGGTGDFPDVLRYDHTYWISIGGPAAFEPYRSQGYIMSLSDHQIKYAILEDGKIVEADRNCKPKPDSHYIDMLSGNENDIQGLARFEAPANIVLHRDKNDIIQKVTMPRYVSLDDNPLVFEREGDLIVWKDNRQYTLPEKMPQNHLGTINNYVYLKPRDAKTPEKILVPFQPIQRKEIPVPDGMIHINNNVSLIKRTEEKSRIEAQGLYQYFVYNIVQGKVVPTTLEGKLYLAYIYFSQRNYQESIELIKSLKAVDNISPIGMEILNKIIDMPTGEDHPDATMVHLHALALKMKEEDKNASEQIKEYFQSNDEEVKKLGRILIKIGENIQSLNNISAACRMPTELEKYLLEKLVKEGRAKESTLSVHFKDHPFSTTFKQMDSRLIFIKNKKRVSPIDKFISRKREKKITDSRREYSNYKEGKLAEKLPARPTEPESSAYKYKTRYDLQHNKISNTFCDESISYEEAKETYLENLSTYKTNLEKCFKWLNEGTLPARIRRPGAENNSVKNGKLFQEVYRTAKTGDECKRNRLLYQLHLWRIHKADVPFLDEMIAILSNPSVFPVMINFATANVEDKLDFIKRVDAAYTSNFQNRQLPGLESLCKNAYKPGPGNEFRPGGYPILPESTFETEVKETSHIASQKIGIKVDMDPNEKRWEKLQAWKHRFLTRDVNQNDAANDQDFFFRFDENLLSKREQKYRVSLEKDLQLLQKEYNAGKEQNSQTVSMTAAKDSCRALQKEAKEVLATRVQQRRLKEASLLAKANIRNPDELARQAELARIGGQSLKALDFYDCMEGVLSLDQREFILKNEHLKDSDTCKEIADLTLAVEDLKSYEAQLGRIIQLADDILAIEDPQDATRRYLCQKLSAELDARYHFDGFSPDEEVALRVFAGESGIIPFKKQTDLIKMMLELEEKDPAAYKDIVIQLIMGGGKTSVIATIVLYLAARRKGRLAVFIVPSALLDTIKSNLSQSMWQAFRKKVLCFDLCREDLTSYTLERLQADIQKAQKEGLPIVTNPTTLQCLELELLSEARKCKDRIKKSQEVSAKIRDMKNEADKLEQNLPSPSVYIYSEQMKLDQIRLSSLKKGIEVLEKQKTSLDQEIQKLRPHIKKLFTLAVTFPELADALIDEIDIILDCLQQVNFPEGKEISLKSVRNRLLHKIYSILIKPDLKVKTLPGNPSIDDIVQLKNNGQSEMSQDVYLQHIIPIVAQQLVEQFPSVGNYVDEGHNDAFVRYVTGKIPTALQDLSDRHAPLTKENCKKDEELNKYPFQDLQDDLAFLNYLRDLHGSGDENSIEAANLISLTKHFLLELTPHTLSKSGRRDFGPSPKKDILSKIIPFLAVNTPSTNEFGYHWEGAAFTYQYGLGFLPEKELIRDIATAAMSAARYYIQKNGEKLEETAEYEEFFQLFGVKLDQIDEPGKLEQAQANVANDYQKRLDLQFEIAAKNVRYRTERLTSNGTSFCNQLSTRRTMSATPWNVEGFVMKLARRFVADEGTEGKILHKLAQRLNTKKIHEISFDTIDDFMTKIYKGHRSPKRIRGIIDTGGLFKKFLTNANVAQDLIQFLAKHQELKDGWVDPNIEGVLFFHNDPGQKQPNTLYVWKKGASSPERIGDTTQETLKAKGLDPSRYFVLYDERHGYGTDILQVPDAIDLLTVDVKMLRRTMGQGIMRERQYFFEQDVEIVVTTEGRRNMVHGGSDKNDFVLNGEKNQSIRKTRDMVRFYMDQIDDIFRRQALKKVFDAIRDDVSDERFAAIIETYEKFFVSSMVEDPYIQHGKLVAEKNTKTILKGRLEHKLKCFERYVQDAEALTQVQKDAAALRNWIDEATCLPLEWKDTEAIEGIEQEVSVHEHIHQEVDVSIEEEIEMELQRYEQSQNNLLRHENEMSEQDFLAYVGNLKKDQVHDFGIISLQEQLQKFDYGLYNDKAPFDRIFSEPIYGTKNYFYACDGEGVLPVFHSLQRPPKQILAVRGPQGMRWLLLSEHEADAVQQHLLNLYKSDPKKVEGVWLIQPDATQLCKDKNIEEFPVELKGVIEGLLEINAFGGNAAFLDDHREVFEAWLNKEQKLKIRFIKLKTARNKVQNQIFRRSPIISKLDEDMQAEPGAHMFLLREERERVQQGKYKPENVKEIKSLPPQKIKDLNIHYVKYLEGSQLQYISEFQGPYITPAQIPHLPIEKVQFLEHTEQIFDGKNYLLSREQATGLKEKQRHLIKSINPEFYQDFKEKWQIRSIDPKYIDKIQTKYWMFLSKQHLKAIVVRSKADLKYLSPMQLGWIHGNYIKYVDPALLSRVNAEQVREITDIPLIRQLEKLAAQADIEQGLWTSWIDPSMVSHIDPETQLKHLKINDLISRIPSEWICRLDPKSQVPLIDSHQVKFLKGKDQIQACPLKYTKDLDESQFPYISVDQVHYFGENQVKLIQDEKIFAKLQAEDRPELGLFNQMHWIADSQLKWVTQEQIKGLSNDQILKLKRTVSKEKWKDLREGLVQRQAVSFDSPELIKTLSSSQIESWLTSEQTQYMLTPKLVKATPSRMVHFLTSRNNFNQVRHISADQVPFLRAHQIADCPDHFIPILTKNDLCNQISEIDELRLHLIEPNQVRWLTNVQLLQLKKRRPVDWKDLLQNLVQRQIDTFDSMDLVGLLSAEQIHRFLEKKQLPYLSEAWQIKAIRDELVEHLATSQIPHIKDEQVPLTVKGQFTALIDGHVALLKPKQIHTMDTAREVARLQCERQFCHLSASGIKALNDGQIQELQNHPSLHEKIPDINASQVHLITNEHAAGYVTNQQIGAMDAAQINNMPDNHPLWKRLPADRNVIGKVALPKIKCLANERLKYISDPQKIRSLPYRKVEYLSRQQLRERSWCQYMTYTLGVLTLGVASNFISLLGQVMLFNLHLICNSRVQKWYKARTFEHSHRLNRYFEVYWSGI